MREIHSDDDLQQFAAEMRQVAVDFPFDPIAALKSGVIGPEATERYRKALVIDQVGLKITYTIMDMGLRKGHMLSLCDLDGRPLSDNIVFKVLIAFFGPEETREWDVMRLPESVVNPPVRKYMQLVGRSNATHSRSKPPVDLN